MYPDMERSHPADASCAARVPPKRCEPFEVLIRWKPYSHHGHGQDAVMGGILVEEQPNSQLFSELLSEVLVHGLHAQWGRNIAMR